MSCRRFESLISAHVDGLLTQRQESMLMGHLGECHSCAVRLARYRQMEVLLRRLPQVETPPSLRDRVLGALEVKRHIWQGFSLPIAAAAAVVFLMAAATSALVKPSHIGQIAQTVLDRADIAMLGPEVAREPELFSGLEAQASRADSLAAGDSAVLTQVRRTIVTPEFRPVLPAYLPRGARLANVYFGRAHPGGPIDRLEVAYAAGTDRLNLRQLSGPFAANKQEMFASPPAPLRVMLGGDEWLVVRRTDGDSRAIYVLVGERNDMTILLESSLPMDELERVAASLRE